MSETLTANSSADRTDTQGAANGQVPDVAIAGVIAKAVLAVPDVVRLYPGHSSLAATYGPLLRVTGVVVRRSAPAERSVEVHVVLRAAAPALPPKRGKGSSSPAGGSLPALAAKVREAVFRAFGEMSLPSPVAVDVFIDDIV